MPRPSGWRIMRWLPEILATSNPALSIARTAWSPRNAGTASGDLDGHRQLVRDAELGDQPSQCLAKISDRGIGGVSLAVRADAGPQLRMGTPHAVFVLLDRVQDMHGSGHRASCILGGSPHSSYGGYPWQCRRSLRRTRRLTRGLEVLPPRGAVGPGGGFGLFGWEGRRVGLGPDEDLQRLAVFHESVAVRR